jgi:hypothetical protein
MNKDEQGKEAALVDLAVHDREVHPSGEVHETFAARIFGGGISGGDN